MTSRVKCTLLRPALDVIQLLNTQKGQKEKPQKKSFLRTDLPKVMEALHVTEFYKHTLLFASLAGLTKGWSAPSSYVPGPLATMDNLDNQINQKKR